MSHALQFLVFTMAGWLNRQQEDLIDYLREENRVLREQLGGLGSRTDATVGAEVDSCTNAPPDEKKHRRPPPPVFWDLS